MVDRAREDITLAVQRGAMMVEIRLDYLGSRDYGTLVHDVSVPVVWTLRHTSEGGRFDGTVAEEIDQLAAALETGGDYADIEFRRWNEAGAGREKLLNAVRRLREKGRDVKLILSYHDFQSMPADLPAAAQPIIHERAADVVKVVGFARDAGDNFTVFDFLKNSCKPAIGIAMGPAGTASRVLAKKFEAELTFATIEADKSSAPGQLTLDQMKRDYRWDTIDHATMVAGVIGHPVEHSMSPVMHNRAYTAMGFNAVYLKFDVADTYEDFARFIDGIRARPWLGGIGLSVTIPHKTHAIRYLESNGFDVSPLAQQIGAVNTLVFPKDGSLSGYNTDYVGILESLRTAAGLDRKALRGQTVAVLGGGGVSRAIVAAMAEVEADVTVYNRTESKARDLANEFGVKWDAWERRNDLKARILINGTSVGMHPKVDDCPVDPTVLRPGMIVFDTIYNPLQTRLLEAARESARAGGRPVSPGD